MKTYNVWMNEEDPEVFENHDEAFDTWHQMANASNAGDTAYICALDADGDYVEGSQRRLENEDGNIFEYDENGSRCWAE